MIPHSRLVRRATVGRPLCPPCAQCHAERRAVNTPTTWTELRCYPPAIWHALTFCSYRCLSQWALERARIAEGAPQSLALPRRPFPLTDGSPDA